MEATTIWTGGGASDLWSDAGNWSAGVPVNGDDLVFGASGRALNFDDLLSLTIGGLTFSSGAPTYQLSILGGGAVSPLLSITGAGISNASGIMQNLRVEADATPNDRGATLEFRSGTTVAADVRITTGKRHFFQSRHASRPDRDDEIPRHVFGGKRRVFQ